MSFSTPPEAADPQEVTGANPLLGRPSPIARRFRPAILAAASLLAAPAAVAEVQATPKNSKEFIASVCMSAINDRGRAAIAERGKDTAGVCDCTADRMWRAFPSIYFWVQETTPYERNLVEEEFPKALTACIVE